MSLSRPTASRFTRKIACTAGVVAGLLGFAAVPALADEGKVAPRKPAPAKVNAELAVCPGQTFSQPFEALKDSSYYTLVQGSEFNGPKEGWELSNGAEIVEGTGPEGSVSSLNLPSGAEAVSPPVCVTLLYPTARVYVQNVEGGGGVAVSVAYAGTKSEEKPKNVVQVHGEHGEWTLSNPFNVQPQIAGKAEETRQVRFHFTAGGKNNDYRLYGLYVDPRMR
jgi:hypothetical protein